MTKTNSSKYRDEYTAPNGFRISIELCHGAWTSFARNCNEDPSVKVHASREAANAWAAGL